MLSLEFILGFCYEIAKRGDCKVEFIQSFCWLYSVPNILVIQHLETLYLGGNHVRVVCKRVCRKAQECTLKKSLATGSRDWRVAKGDTRVKHARGTEGSHQLLHYRTKLPVWTGN